MCIEKGKSRGNYDYEEGRRLEMIEAVSAGSVAATAVCSSKLEYEIICIFVLYVCTVQ
jgi:hypothetical protein